jgi:orotate phosphoribosyltransferase
MADDYDADQVDVVIGPTMGGAVLAQWMAYHLNAKRTAGETLPAFAEKLGEGEQKRFVIRRGYDSFMRGKSVIVVDDLLTTGASARKVVECVRAHQGKIMAMSVICNRGDVKPADIGNVKINALADVSLEAWPEEECPLCKNNVPINTSLGKGKAFLEKQGVAVLDVKKKAKKKNKGKG